MHPNDRRGLEHLCRVGARPPVTLSRLSKIPDRRYSYSLKVPLPDGSMNLILEGQSLMARLALLIPRPRCHLTRYKGVFAAHSRRSPLIVPASAPSHTSLASIPSPVLPSPSHMSPNGEVFIPEPAPNPRDRYLDWAALLRRVWTKPLRGS